MAIVLVLDGINGRRLVLVKTRPVDEEGIWAYRVTLTLPGGTISIEVWDSGLELASYLRELSDAWRGFRDAKEYAALEGQLKMVSRHDGRGTVLSELTLRKPVPPAWALTADFDFGAGAHLERIARDAEEFVGR